MEMHTSRGEPVVCGANVGRAKGNTGEPADQFLELRIRRVYRFQYQRDVGKLKDRVKGFVVCRKRQAERFPVEFDGTLKTGDEQPYRTNTAHQLLAHSTSM